MPTFVIQMQQHHDLCFYVSLKSLPHIYRGTNNKTSTHLKRVITCITITQLD